MMEHYLTRKARPFLLRRMMEAIMLLLLGVWLAAGVFILLDIVESGVDAFGLLAWLIVFGVPLLIVVLLVRCWLNRRNARKVARVLAWSTEEEIPWALMDERAKVRDAQALVGRLCELRYLRNVTPDFAGVRLSRHATAGSSAVPGGGKCPMCGAQLE